MELNEIEDKLEELSEDILATRKELNNKLKLMNKLVATKYDMCGRSYYTYIVLVNGRIKYVGKGKKERWKHALSGASSVPELNRDLFAGKHIEVRRFGEYMTETQALEAERDIMFTIISDQSKLYNKSYQQGGCYWDICLVSITTFLGSTDNEEWIWTDDRSGRMWECDVDY